MGGRTRPVGAVLGLAAAMGVSLGVAAVADGGVSIETPPALKVRGSIRPAGDSDAFVFEAVAGTAITVSVRADPRSTLAPALLLSGPGGPVDLSGSVVAAGGKVSLRAFTLPGSAHGLWTLSVAGEGAGDYALSMKAVPPKGASGDVPLPASGTASFSFVAPRGSVLAISVKADRGVAATPRLGLLNDGIVEFDLGGGGKKTATSHATTVSPGGAGGDLELEIRNEADVGGGVHVTVKIRAPKVKPRTLDVRGSALGRPGGGETYIARTVGPAGAVIDSGEAGFALDVPGGALTLDRTIEMVSVPDPGLPSADDQFAGPAVDLRPSGLQFAIPATLTLPWDPALLPGNADTSDLRVLVVEADGTTFELAPTAVGDGTLTVPVGGFSICIPVVRSGIAPLGVRPGGDEFWHLTLEFGVLPDVPGRDSRERRMLLEVGEASFHADGTLEVSSSWRSTTWRNAARVGGGIDHGISATETGLDYGAEWNYAADGRGVEIVEGDGGAVLAVSRDGSVMVSWQDADPGEPGETGWTLLLRKPAQAPTVESLTGAWTLGGVEVSVNSFNTNAPGSLEAQRFFGTLAVSGATARFQLRERETRVDGGTGARIEEIASEKGSATLAAAGDGTFLLTIPPPPGETGTDVMRLYPAAGGNVMFMVDDGPCGACVFAAVLVRQSSGLSTAALSGTYRGMTQTVEVRSYVPGVSEGVPVQHAGDPGLSSLRFQGDFAGGKQATIAGTESSSGRDPEDSDGTPDGVQVEGGPVNIPLTVAVDSKGVLTISPAGQPSLLRGAVSADGMVALLITNPEIADSDGLLGIMVRSPPATE